MHAAEFRTYVLYRFGKPLFSHEGPCSAYHQHSYVFGDHAIACASQGERIAWHNDLRDALFQAAASASLAPQREERALLPGVEQRPADVLLPHFFGGKHCCVDVCVVSSLQNQLVDRAAAEAGFALQFRYGQKWDKYGPACDSEGLVFQPLPIEVLGGWHEAGVGLVKRLGQALARSNGQEEDIVTKHLFQKLSVLLMRGNSQLVLNRLPQSDTRTDGIL